MKTILVVDDSKIMRNIVKKLFLELRVECAFFEAADGKEAMDLLTAQSIDVVFLDWNMPKLSGIDFLKSVRGMGKYKKLPIIMVTSESAKYNIIEALKVGATDYIVKPVNEKLFKEKLSKIID